MSFTMYAVGFVIFSAYLWFTIWNINHSSKKQEDERPSSYDVMDMDGHGNWGRFPSED